MSNWCVWSMINGDAIVVVEDVSEDFAKASVARKTQARFAAVPEGRNVTLADFVHAPEVPGGHRD